MKLSFKVSKLALRDLNSIWIYSADKWSRKQADRYYNEIFEMIDEICENPKIGRTLNDVKEGHRSKTVKSHLIIYKVKEREVFIDRILHQRMDVDHILHED